MYKFYDTCSLLIEGEAVFRHEYPIVISSITLNELENIKTAANKDNDVKFAARQLTRLLELHPDAYEVWIFNNSMLAPIEEKCLDITNDTKILATAIDYDRNCHPDETIFVTNDLALKNIANLFFGTDSIESVEEAQDDYTGYKELVVSEEEQCKLYNLPHYNHYDLYKGEYLILRNPEGKIVELRRWDGESYQYLNTDAFDSKWFGKVKPYNNDVYQKLAFDSLHTNQLTILRGKSGSGKSYLALSALMSKLEHGEIDRIVIFCNPVATKDSAKLGLG